MRETKLEETVKSMVALKRITSPTGVISDRAKRKLESFAQEAYGRLKNGQGFSVESVVTADIKWKDEERAKGMVLGIKEFSDKYPAYGSILHEIISQHRNSRRTYVAFGLANGEDLPAELYIDVIMSLGEEFTKKKSEKLYKSMSEFWDKIGRVKEGGKYDILLSE